MWDGYLEPKNSKGEDNKAFNNPMHTEKTEDFTMLDIKKELKERIRTKNKMLIGFDL